MFLGIPRGLERPDIENLLMARVRNALIGEDPALLRPPAESRQQTLVSFYGFRDSLERLRR